MARFRGTVVGGRGEASRLGHSISGITTRAQSWNGQIVVQMYANGDEDCVRITAEDHGGRSFFHKQPIGFIFDGPISDLHQMLALWRRRDEFQAYIALTEGVNKDG